MLFLFQVEPFASLVTLSGFSVPRLLLNREPVGPFKHRHKRPTDVARTGELVEGVEQLVRSAGWEEDLRRLQGRPADGNDAESAAAAALKVPEVEVEFSTPALETSRPTQDTQREEQRGDTDKLEAAFSGLTVNPASEEAREECGRREVCGGERVLEVLGEESERRKVCGGVRVLEVLGEDSGSGEHTEQEGKLKWRLNSWKDKKS